MEQTTQNVTPIKKGVGMIKLNYKTLNSPEFNQALAILSNQTGFSNFDAAYNVAKIWKKFQNALVEAREIYTKLSEPYYVKDESGKNKMATEQNGFSPFEIAEGKMEEFKKMTETFLVKEVDIQASPIKTFDLGNIRLSPMQMVALEPIFDSEAFGTSEPSPSTH